MKRLAVLAGMGLALALGPAEARSAGGTEAHGKAEGGHEAEDGHEAVPFYMNQDLWKFINLGVIVLIAMRLGAGALGPALQQRGETVRRELDEARVALETAEKRLDDAEFRLARLHDEIEELKRDGRKAAQAEKERIAADARAAAEEVGRRTRSQLALETQKAKRELREYLAALVVERVRQELRSKVERQGDAPFVNTILDRVEALPSARA
jgi:F-type H+-transporting ATPase subunit b